MLVDSNYFLVIDLVCVSVCLSVCKCVSSFEFAVLGLFINFGFYFLICLMFCMAYFPLARSVGPYL